MASGAIVLLTDFGLKERFVASMKGVIYSVNSDLGIFDLSHDIQPYNIWEAAEILSGTIPYWPEGTVFVAVVDPGVGSSRRSILAHTRSNHYITAPDNGIITLAQDRIGLNAVREIDENRNRRPGSEDMHTFHGRDIYAYTGARLASGIIEFNKVGGVITDLVRINYPQPEINEGKLSGFIVKTEEPFGNLVTNIPAALFHSWHSSSAGSGLQLEIRNKSAVFFKNKIRFVKSFGGVEIGEPLAYLDSLGFTGIALNQRDFAATYKTGSGPDWLITFSGSN